MFDLVVRPWLVAHPQLEVWRGRQEAAAFLAVSGENTAGIHFGDDEADQDDLQAALPHVPGQP